MTRKVLRLTKDAKRDDAKTIPAHQTTSQHRTTSHCSSRSACCEHFCCRSQIHIVLWISHIEQFCLSAFSRVSSVRKPSSAVSGPTLALKLASSSRCTFPPGFLLKLACSLVEDTVSKSLAGVARASLIFGQCETRRIGHVIVLSV